MYRPPPAESGHIIVHGNHGNHTYIIIGLVTTDSRWIHDGYMTPFCVW